MVSEAWKEIKKNPEQPVYLLTGSELYLLQQTLAKIISETPGIEQQDVIYFDLEETPVDRVIEEADTLPFLQDRKVIVAKNASFLKAKERGKEKIEHPIAQLEAWLQDPSPTATVIFTAPYEKLDSRKKITKVMSSNAFVIEANKLTGTDLAVWVQQQATAFGVVMDRDIADYLVEATGENMMQLSKELEKLAAYLGDAGKITKEVIDSLVPRSPETEIFRLTDTYIAGNRAKTLAVYHDLLRSGEEPIAMTSLIAGQVRLMLHVGTLKRKGYHQQQIASTLNVHPYRVKLVMNNRNSPSEQRLLRVLNDLASIDLKLKSTSGSRERVLELFFMEKL
ncbi:DNA polymerase III subunit delta [Sporosarcina gallistercoris]|uniref:DNA polymerase III subunit delta n=1 Tax=Sporosarcina gallistercoris TaxID=2762245 RepID=A0ABR8PFC2_9BACL|nr:DNA polymerase III subunit delta [Sporosarcina gallistercoris]MBD7906878.1 DNA polymerase III subunit delta [Sporosarcina gallistercoris]